MKYTVQQAITYLKHEFGSGDLLEPDFEYFTLAGVVKDLSDTDDEDEYNTDIFTQAYNYLFNLYAAPANEYEELYSFGAI